MKLIVGISELEFENNVVTFEISTLEFVKNEFLTHTMNFRIGPAFSQGPGLGSLYKVCQYKLFFSSVLFSLRIQLCMNTQQYFLE